MLYRFLVPALLMLLLPAPREAWAQEVSLGVLAGGDVMDNAGADVRWPHDRFGFLGGGFVRIEFGSRLALEPELLYTMKGGKENVDRVPAGEKADEISLRYVEIPLLLRLALAPRSRVVPQVFVGPTVSFEASCRFDAFPGGSSQQIDCVDEGISTRSPDVGLTFGAALDVPAGKGALLFDARGNVGLRSYDDSPEELDFKNRILSLMVGYRFGR